MIVTEMDHFPGDKAAYQEAVQRVLEAKEMPQEQVDPSFRSLVEKIEKMRLPSVSSDGARPAKKETALDVVPEEDIASGGLSAIDERDVGMALRKEDR